MPQLSQKSDDIWTFRCYDPSDSGSGFHGWYDALEPDVQAEIDTAIELLSRTREWHRPGYEDLRGACRGLGEIIVDTEFFGEKRSYRLLGFKGPGRREFTLLTGFEKIDGSEYSTECPKALKRMKGVLKDGRRAPVCQFP